MSVYLATFLLVGYAAVGLGVSLHQWVALISVTSATAVTVWMVDGGRWNLGLLVSPRLAAIDLLLGAAFAACLILFGDALVLATTKLRHVRGGGFPALELLTVFVPAALHEELAFRGYLFQKLRRWRRDAAIIITSIVFAALHWGNRGLTALAMVNLILAGVLLALAYERYERLWFPIGIHLVWNILSGPILGYGVSGYMADATVFRTVGSGPVWLTGGEFGIEGSVWMGVAEVGGILWLKGSRFEGRGKRSKGQPLTS